MDCYIYIYTLSILWKPCFKRLVRPFNRMCFTWIWGEGAAFQDRQGPRGATTCEHVATDFGSCLIPLLLHIIYAIYHILYTIIYYIYTEIWHIYNIIYIYIDPIVVVDTPPMYLWVGNILVLSSSFCCCNAFRCCLLWCLHSYSQYHWLGFLFWFGRTQAQFPM